eukprot:1351039-Pleurochrysis_carterae.AAC.3
MASPVKCVCGAPLSVVKSSSVFGSICCSLSASTTLAIAASSAPTMPAKTRRRGDAMCACAATNWAGACSSSPSGAAQLAAPLATKHEDAPCTASNARYKKSGWSSPFCAAACRLITATASAPKSSVEYWSAMSVTPSQLPSEDARCKSTAVKLPQLQHGLVWFQYSALPV